MPKTLPALLAPLMAVVASAAAEDLVWTPSPWFAERVTTFDLEPGVRVHVNQPTDPASAERPTRLLVYATPNGNTLEQTLGCVPGGGRNWRHLIQHVAAQTRWLREQTPDERIVLLVAQPMGLSWPAWRRGYDDANQRIARTVADWRERFGGPDLRVTLAAHSGGGSFLWGAIEGQDALPDWADRIVFLDANY